MSQHEQWQISGNAPEAYERYMVLTLFTPWASSSSKESKQSGWKAAVATPIEPPSFRWGAQPQDWTTYQEAAVRPLYEAVFDRLGLTAGTRLLDVGCGAGLAAQLAASRGARVWGLDASAAMLEIARSRVPEGEFRLGDMAALPYAEASFDVVTGFNSFQFVTDLAAVFGEVKRVIWPGGSVVVAVWGRPEECESAATINARAGWCPIPVPACAAPSRSRPRESLKWR